MAKIEFKELWVGDRFEFCKNTLWTKISHDTARKHSKDSIKLKEKSYGYIGDTVCYFELKDKVKFVVI